MSDATTRTDILVDRCVSFRELTRGGTDVMNELERDGKSFAISRYGRIVALLVPLPERIVLEFDEGKRTIGQIAIAAEVDLESLGLGELAREFLVDAASTPTGNWWMPEAELAADMRRCMRIVHDMDFKGLTDGTGGMRRLTKKGRAVAKELMRRGQKGWEELHGDGAVSSVVGPAVGEGS